MYKARQLYNETHKHVIVYDVKGSNEESNARYIGECSKRLQERVIDDSERDKASHLLKLKTHSLHYV